jgi:Peptidase S46
MPCKHARRALWLLCTWVCFHWPSSAFADEGMWTLDALPKTQLQRYGFMPTQQWLDHVRASSARLSSGCSASFVSGQGLVLTNHHCAHNCIQRLSTQAQDYVANGFYAATASQERVCPGLDVSQLLEIRDVTAQLDAATQGLDREQFHLARKAAIAALERNCSQAPKFRCDVVSLYHGGLYHLYRYRRYDEVRLVFAPEFRTAFFGGDPDNFNFPRHDLDAALLRVYEAGVPAVTEQHLAWSARGIASGELTFVSGHPGATERLWTIAQLEDARERGHVEWLLQAAQYRGFLQHYASLGKEQKRVATEELFGIENGFKVFRGELEALNDAHFFSMLVEREQALRQRVNASAVLRAKYGGSWEEIAAALERFRPLRAELLAAEGWRGTPWWAKSPLFWWARTVLRGAEERDKPNAERLEEFGDSRLPRLEKGLLAERPLDRAFEIAKLTFGLTALREALGPDHAMVKRVLGVSSPEQVATRLVRGSTLADPKVRLSLWQGGAEALRASKDPMLEMVRAIDADARRLRAAYESQIEATITKNSERVARARFEVYGTSSYPDATHTLRLSFGRVRGWLERGRAVSPFTTFGDAFARATGQDPYALPSSWTEREARLKFDTPLNFVSDNDIIGGNSGSPVVNRRGELVGLVFDGNIHALGGAYGFEPERNRAVSVDARGLLYALQEIYGASRVVGELTLVP